MSLSIPAEIIDEIIDDVQDLHNVKSLCNLTLTSHLFLPRSRYHLFSSHIRLNSIKRLNSFCDFLDAHPDWRPWVRSVAICSTKGSPSLLEVVPVRILTNLPNWNEWTLVASQLDNDSLRRYISANTRKLTCLRHYARAITRLCLDRTSFSSCADFVRYILAFSGLRHLHCKRVKFKHNDDVTALDRARERLSKDLHLSHLTIDSSSDVAVTLLLESAQYALQELVIDVTLYIPGGPELDDKLPNLVARLSSLSSITLRVQYRILGGIDSMIRPVVEILQALASNPSSLVTEIIIHSHDLQISMLIEYLRKHSDDLGQTCRTLETALLRLPHLRKIELCHRLRRPLRHWTPMRIEQLLPTLHKRGLVTTRCLAPPIQCHSSAVMTVAVSPDSRWVASGSSDTTIILWDAQRGTIVHEWPAHSYTVASLAFSPDGRHLASLGDDRKVMVWDTSDETATRLVTTLESADAFVWLPDGTIRTSGGIHSTVQVWSASAGQTVGVCSLEGYSESPWSTTMKFSCDGRWIAVFVPTSGSWDVWDATTGTRLRSVLTARAESSWGLCTFDPAGRRVVIRSDDDSARIWDVETGDELAVLERLAPMLGGMTFSPDGTRVLSAGSDNHTVRLWDSFSGDVLLSFCGHKSSIYAMCFSPDGKYIASASRDHTMRLWNASTGSCIRTFTEHDDVVWLVAFSPDGETLVSGGWKGSVCIRRMRDVCPEYLDLGDA